MLAYSCIYNLNTYTYGLLKCFDLILYIFEIEIIKKHLLPVTTPSKITFKKKREKNWYLGK